MKHGLGGLLRLSGRDGPLLFWSYAGVVTVLSAVAGLAGLVTAAASVMTKLQRYMLEHPDQVTVQADGSKVIHGDPDFMPDFGLVFGGGVAIAVVFVALMLAASVRRLHDTGRTGWWAVAPLPFMAICFAAAPTWVRSLDPPINPDFVALGVMAAGWLACLVSAAVLTALLTARGSPETNRFGPPSA